MSVKKITVTGAGGFIAAHIVKQLLEKGYIVHGTVRDPTDTKKNDHILSLPGAKERLKLFAADLTAGSEVFVEAIRGTSAVIHTATPVISSNSEDVVVKPAVNGTLNVLKAVESLPEVKRVVLTSSAASIIIDGGKLPASHIFTSDDWSDEEYLRKPNPGYGLYPLSKVLAERAAWDFVTKQTKRPFSLVVLHPAIVIGPNLQQGEIGYSNPWVTNLFNGSLKEIPRGDIPFVDVRDTAEAHIAAVEKESAEGRYLLIHSGVPFTEIVDILKKVTTGKKYGFPEGTAEGGFEPFGKKRYDNKKGLELLGRPFRSPEESIKDLVKDVEDYGLVKQIQ